MSGGAGASAEGAGAAGGRVTVGTLGAETCKGGTGGQPTWGLAGAASEFEGGVGVGARIAAVLATWGRQEGQQGRRPATVKYGRPPGGKQGATGRVCGVGVIARA